LQFLEVKILPLRCSEVRTTKRDEGKAVFCASERIMGAPVPGRQDNEQPTKELQIAN
jgi:hypothetical protein